MNEHRIVGYSRPNLVRLKSLLRNNTFELPKRTVRRLMDEGIVKIQNPDSLYIKI